jgi:hypothetical protein
MVALAYLDMGQPAGRENHCRQQVGFFLMIMYGVAKIYRSNKAAQSFTNHKFFLCYQKPLGKPEKSNETRFPRFVFFQETRVSVVALVKPDMRLTCCRPGRTNSVMCWTDDRIQASLMALDRSRYSHMPRSIASRCMRALDSLRPPAHTVRST